MMKKDEKQGGIVNKPDLLGGKRSISGSLIETKTNSLISEISSFDLSEVNLIDLTRDMQNSLTASVPSTIFFRNRQNRKLGLDVERQRWLLTKLQGLRSLGQELVNLRADAIVSEQMVKMLAQNKLKDAEIEYQKRVRDLKAIDVEVKQFEYLIKEIDYKTDNLKIQYLRGIEQLLGDRLENIGRYEANRRMRIENENLRKVGKGIDIENKGKKIDNEGRSEKVRLLQKFIKQMKVKSVPVELQSYVLASYFNSLGANFSEHEKQAILNRYLDKERKIEVKKRKHEAESLKSKAKSDKSQADVQRASADVSVHDLESELDEED